MEAGKKGVYSGRLDGAEREFFESVFSRLKEEFGITATDELIGLERTIKNYIKLQRAESQIAKEGDTITIATASGTTYKRIHPLMPWISTWESQLRSWMKEMRFTRKEKKEGEVQQKDIAKELAKTWENKKRKLISKN